MQSWSWNSLKKTDWAGQDVHFHLVDFAGGSRGLGRKGTDRKTAGSPKSPGGRGEKRKPWLLLRLPGNGEAGKPPIRPSLLHQEQEQEAAAEWAFVEAAVLGEQEAAWQVYQMLKAARPEQSRVFLKLAAEAVRDLEISENYTEAIAWYRKLAEEKKDGTACFRLGWMASQGEGTEKRCRKSPGMV